MKQNNCSIRRKETLICEMEWHVTDGATISLSSSGRNGPGDEALIHFLASVRSQLLCKRPFGQAELIRVPLRRLLQSVLYDHH